MLTYMLALSNLLLHGKILVVVVIEDMPTNSFLVRISICEESVTR